MKRFCISLYPLLFGLLFFICTGVKCQQQDSCFISEKLYNDISSQDNQCKNIIVGNEDTLTVFHYKQIMSFLEDLRTAYNQKEIRFLEEVFTSSFLKIRNKERDEIENQAISKHRYLKNLKYIFKKQKHFNVEFDEIEIIQHEYYKEIYGITFKQIWSSSTYKDVGYVFLMIDFRNESQPKIQVCTWLPEEYNAIYQKERFQLQDFDIN